MREFGLIGYPLGHSFSKKYFTDKFSREGIIDCSYTLFPLNSLQELDEVLLMHPGLSGLNVTIPFKQTVINRLDDTSNLPEGITACNCIKITGGKLSGFNTDIVGFEKSLLPLLKTFHTHALILGNGGAAEAVKYVLKKININFKTVSRNLHKDADFIYEDLNEEQISKRLLIINTTPLGTFPEINKCPPIPYHFLSGNHLLYDLVYNPEKTLFLQQGESIGAAIKNGFEMLVLQAEESWRIWNM